MDEGWRTFAAAFTRYLVEAAEADLVASVRTRAARLASSVVEETEATLAALTMSEQDLDTRLSAFQQQLERVEASRFEAAALARATIERLLQETSSQATAIVPTAGPQVERAVSERLTTLRGSPRDVEDAALAYAADRIRVVRGLANPAHCLAGDPVDQPRRPTP